MAEFEEVKTADMHEVHEGPGLPPAVPRLFMALAGGLAVLALPYLLTPLLSEVSDDAELVEEVAAYRAWWPGDKVPFSTHFRTSREQAAVPGVAGLAGAGGPAKLGVDGDPDIEDIQAPVIVEDPAEGPGPVAVPEPGGPDVVSPDSGDAGHSAASGDAAIAPHEKKAPHPFHKIKLPASYWEGLTTTIEDPNNVLAPAWDKLARAILHEEGQVFRLSHFGDSAIAADGMPSSTRRYLQRVAGDGGHGFSLVAASNAWYKRKDVEWTSRGFTTEVFISDGAKDRRYGFGGTVAVGGPGARATWKTIAPREGEALDKVSGSRVSRFIVYHQANKNGGELTVFVDGAEHTKIDLTGESAEDKKAVVELADGPHTIELRVTSGRARIYGVALERERGAIVDGLGIIGARDTRWLNFDPEHVVWAFESRGPDLAAFMYGGNQLEDKVSMAAYKEKLTETVRLWKRGLGERSCLLVSPIDHGERHRGRVRTVPRQVEIMKVQREVALAEGCAWFSLYDAMGGDGSIGKWFEQGLAEGDLAHPTAKGALALGRLFFMALMKGLNEHLERTLARHEEEDPKAVTP